MVKNYWNELGLKERWSKRERFNYILNYIDKLTSSGDNSESSNSDNPTSTNNNEGSTGGSGNSSGTGGNDSTGNNNDDNTGNNDNTDEPTDTIIKKDISINVMDIDGNPISGAKVTVSNNDKEYTGNTGSAGGCTIRNVPLGDYTISTEKTGYIITEDDFTVTEDTDTVEIVLDVEQAGL